MQDNKRLNAGALRCGVTIDGMDYLYGGLPDGLELAVESAPPAWQDGYGARMRFHNRSSRPVRLDGFFWDAATDELAPSANGFSSCYLDGWSMPTPCGARLFSEPDFRFNPDYLKFAVSEPKDYRAEQPGRFRAENLVVFQDGAAGEGSQQSPSLIFAFVTSEHQFGRFVIDADASARRAAVRCISSCDGIMVPPGGQVRSEALSIGLADNREDAEARIAGYAAHWGRAMNARLHHPAPLGWCSWYYYFEKITEEDMVENIDFLKAHRAEYPVKYIQLDDGYQFDQGEWLVTNEKFPRGLSWLAGYAKDAGFTPGLWLAPFMVSEKCALWREHPEWLIHDADGKIIQESPWRTGMCGILDATHPGAWEWLRGLFAKLREIGFDYVKLDFLVNACAERKGVLHDPMATRCNLLRRGLQAIRSGFGEDGLILTCTVPTAAVVGLADFNRIGTDITPYWCGENDADEAPNVPNVCRNVINRAYMNRRLFVSDPDTIIVREDNTRLSEQECALWRDAIMLGGGSLLLSDRMSTLTPKRAAWLQEIIRHHDEYETVPVDRAWHCPPRIWRGVSRTGGGVIEGRFDFAGHSCELAEVRP